MRFSPHLTSYCYIYDKAGRPRFMVDAVGLASGIILYKKYDVIGRLIEDGWFTGDWGDGNALQQKADTDSNYPQQTAWRKRYIFDGDGSNPYLIGRLWKVLSSNQGDGNSDVEEVYDYDEFGNVVSKTLTVTGYAAQTVSYEYDNLGNVSKVHYPDSSNNIPDVVYSYNSLGETIAIGTPENPQRFATYSYNADGSLGTTTLNMERAWLREVSSVALQQSVRDLGVAYQNFFASVKGKRKGSKVNSPRFKKRRNKQCARLTRNAFTIKNGAVYLAKIGTVKPVWSRELPSVPSSVTIIKDSANRYFLSFVVDIEKQSVPLTNKSIGIDLGIKTFATFDTVEKIDAPKPLKKNLKRLRKLQRNLSRKKKGSKRYEYSRLKVAKLHAKIKDLRGDFLHKLSTDIIRENQTIVLEDLNVSGMVKNRKLSRAISDLGWREFRTFLEAKAKKYGRDFRIIDRWKPTSQTCSCCGFKGGKLDLSIREWQCLNCETTHDRDINAAINIKVAGGLLETVKRTEPAPPEGERPRVGARRKGTREQQGNAEQERT